MNSNSQIETARKLSCRMAVVAYHVNTGLIYYMLWYVYMYDIIMGNISDFI